MAKQELDCLPIVGAPIDQHRLDEENRKITARSSAAIEGLDGRLRALILPALTVDPSRDTEAQILEQ